MAQGARLSPAGRAANLDRLARETFDVVVVGGGVTGAGCALDAATRGLTVALVEQRDLGSGTSSRSSKLVHGGIRYLEQGNLGLVFEALQERSLMLTTLAPHLVRPVSFLYPLTRRVWERAYVGAGIGLYDLFAGRPGLAGPVVRLAHRGGDRDRYRTMAENPLPGHQHLSRRRALRLVPALRADALVGAVRYWDAQVDDARHTLTVARTAAGYGAVVASSLQVTDLLREGDRVVGVRARCVESSRLVDVRARQVINATATWTDQVQGLAGRGRIRVRASKGVHLVVPRDRIHADAGLLLRTPSSVLFVIPWGVHWIIGTTDTDWDLDLAHPAATRTDIDYLLGTVNTVLRAPLTHHDIEGVYAGLRPLLEGESDATSELSRVHAVSQTVPGLVTVAGGKYTTYRVMAADAVDVAARNLSRRAPRSCTDRVPLWGAAGFVGLWHRRERLADESGLHVTRIEHLLRRYGSGIDELLDLVAERPELGRPLAGTGTYLGVEAAYAASHEAALHLDDVLTRRTRLSIETFHRGTDSADAAADLMGDELGWSEARRAEEVAAYGARVAAERASQGATDDRTADAVRLEGPDLRHLAPLAR
ncbi:MAG: FAD-dependent oxidoreductase [Acidimicrobiia bacterium]|nr:FAD-dependent oxidoreductase [Acidimicrobiia bacterium]